MTGSSFLLQAEAIDKSLPGVHALDEVVFDIREGEARILPGENGASKSTLMKVFSGALPKDEGRIVINNQKVEIMTPYHARDLGIGTVYQELSVIPSLGVADNILLGRLPRRATTF